MDQTKHTFWSLLKHFCARAKNTLKPQNIKTPLMKKTLIATVASIALSSGAFSGVGIFGSYIGIDVNGGGNTWYGAQEWGANPTPDFQGGNFGSINYISGGSLIISAYQVQTFKFDGGDITGANLYYRVYKQGDTPGGFSPAIVASFISNSPFTAANGSSASGGGDQNWGLGVGNYANLLTGVNSTGTWNVEIYFDATSNEGTQFSNNGGANYIATFDAVPEPSTYALLGLAAAGLGAHLARRRRR
jgi:hypothetical protein